MAEREDDRGSRPEGAEPDACVARPEDGTRPDAPGAPGSAAGAGGSAGPGGSAGSDGETEADADAGPGGPAGPGDVPEVPATPDPAADGDDAAARPALDEEAAWAELVAAYDEEPGPGSVPWPEAENLTSPGKRDTGHEDTGAGDGDSDSDSDSDSDEDDSDADRLSTRGLPGPPVPEASRVVIHPVISGPRDYELEDEDEGHFEPPEPPPLPETDTTTKFAWLAVLGGPLLIFVFILLQQELPWWAVTVGIGGFLGGFATLVARMRPGGDEDDDLPGGGAVV